MAGHFRRSTLIRSWSPSCRIVVDVASENCNLVARCSGGATYPPFFEESPLKTCVLIVEISCGCCLNAWIFFNQSTWDLGICGVQVSLHTIWTVQRNAFSCLPKCHPFCAACARRWQHDWTEIDRWSISQEPQMR